MNISICRLKQYLDQHDFVLIKCECTSTKGLFNALSLLGYKWKNTGEQLPYSGLAGVGYHIAIKVDTILREVNWDRFDIGDDHVHISYFYKEPQVGKLKLLTSLDDQGYEYITCDKDGTITAFANKPKILGDEWIPENACDRTTVLLHLPCEGLDGVQWGNKNPSKIKKIVKGLLKEEGRKQDILDYHVLLGLEAQDYIYIARDTFGEIFAYDEDGSFVKIKTNGFELISEKDRIPREVKALLKEYEGRILKAKKFKKLLKNVHE